MLKDDLADMTLDFEKPRKRLYFYRRIKKLSQKDMAQAMKTSLRRYQRLEYGESTLTIEDVFLASKALEIQPQFFFNEAEFINSHKPPLPEDLYNTLLQDLTENLDHLIKKDFKKPISENLCDEGYLSHNFLKHFNLSTEANVLWKDIFSEQSLVVGYFENVLNCNTKFFLAMLQINFVGDGIRDTISIGEVTNSSWDNPSTLAIHKNVSDLTEAYSIDIEYLYDQLLKVSKADLTLIKGVF